MIIKDKAYLHSVQEDGDYLKFTHVQDIAPSLQRAQEIKDFSDNGWTKDRTMRQIGVIPEAEFMQIARENPDIMRDGRELYKYLMSDKGAKFRTVRAIDTGRSGKVIVK